MPVDRTSQDVSPMPVNRTGGDLPGPVARIMSNEPIRTYRPFTDSRPYTRWWFYDEIRVADIRTQLQWVCDQGFGGVEIAFMYPQSGAREAPRWLSEAWTGLLVHAKQEADRLDIGCDFTFSTSWPFGGSIVSEEDAGQVFDGASAQRLEKSWELSYYGRGRILNHLDAGALARYADAVGGAMQPALRGTVSALFSDSWEVFPEGLWSAHLDSVFRDRFGYDLASFKGSIDQHPDVRYDYRKLLSEAAIEGFFRPYAEICRRLGAVSRVQCHGAPTDLLAAFALADIPESEALLFETFFLGHTRFGGGPGRAARRDLRDLHLHLRVRPLARAFSPSWRGEGGRHEAHGGRGVCQRGQSHRLARHAVQRARREQYLLCDHARRSGQRFHRPAPGVQCLPDRGCGFSQAGQDVYGPGGVPSAGRPLDAPHAARGSARSGRQLLLGAADG